MRRYAGFALVGMVALWLLSLLPSSASTLANAIVIGLGAAGGTVARDNRDLAALSLGAFVGTLSGFLIHPLARGGPVGPQVLTAGVTVAILVAVAGVVARFVAGSRRPAGPPPR
jgi:hypothetical protein